MIYFLIPLLFLVGFGAGMLFQVTNNSNKVDDSEYYIYDVVIETGETVYTGITTNPNKCNIEIFAGFETLEQANDAFRELTKPFKL